MNHHAPAGASRALFYNAQMQILAEDANRRIVQIRGEQGDGLMSCYLVFPGVFLLFNDFHMKRANSQFTADAAMFCIDHCREGRIEQEIANGAYLYLTVGDVFLI